MRKFIILISTVLVVSCIQACPVSAQEMKEKEVMESMEIDDYIVSFSIDDEKVVYDIDTGSVTINDEIKAYIVTTVSDFDTNYFTKEELLKMDKQYTVEQFENYLVSTNSQTPSDGEGLLQRSYGVSIPTNAPYVSAGTFRKEISELVGEISAGLGILAGIINSATSIPVIPHKTLLELTAKALDLTSMGLELCSGSITAVWTYQMHRTKSTYTVGITNQYGYRYANNGVDYEVKTKEQTVDIQKNNNSNGSWWVTQKPF